MLHPLPVGGETIWQHIPPSSPAFNMWKVLSEELGTEGRGRGHCHSWGTAVMSEVGGGWAGADGGGGTRHWDPATGSRGLSGARLRHLLDIVNYLRSFFRSSFPYSFILSFSHTYFGSTSCVPNTANKKGPILPLMEPAAHVWGWRNK